jgi:hypothetical protein
VRRRAISGAELAGPTADEAVEATLPFAAEAAELTALPRLEAVEPAVSGAADDPLAVLPMILSFTFVTAVRGCAGPALARFAGG